MGLRTFDNPSEIGGVSVPGHDGIIINTKTIRLAPQELVIAGLLKGTDTADLASKFKTLSEVVNSSPEPLIINTGSRTIRARKTNISVDRLPSGGKALRISITFLAESIWQDNIPAETDLGTFAGYPKAALKSVTLSGSYKTYPTILWRPAATIQDPTVTWYGRNLIKNSSFVDGTTDWTIAGNARWERYANKYVGRVALNHSLSQSSIPCNASTTYYFSAYAASDTTATARMTVEWYTSADALISSNNIDLVTTGTLTRFSSSIASPGTAAYFKLILKSTVDAVFVFITDVQVEESATLSEYMPSQDVTFAITGNTQFASGDVLEIDCEKKTVRHWNAGTWTNRIDKSNAQFFHLIPGKNLWAFANELNANAQVFVRHVEKYLGY